MGLYTSGQMMNDPLYGHISYTSSLSKAIKLKLGNNRKQVLVEIKVAKGKDIAEYEIKPARVIPTNLLTVRYTPLLISTLGHRRDLMKITEWWTRLQVGQRLTVVLM